MAVGASLTDRRTPAAELAAGAVDDDARQDERHAGDTNHVRGVLGREAGVRVVIRRAEMDHDVRHATRRHQRQAEQHREGETSDPLYRKHGLEIHLMADDVNCIAQIGL
jgi:hypothetical protein